MSIVVIGNFDGVHQGHQAVLAHAAALAPELPLVAMTFWPHPSSVVAPARAPRLLTTLERRIDLLQRSGADRVVVIPFTPELSQLSPAEFVETWLMHARPHHVVVGENFRFGHKAAGDITTLTELGRGRFQVSADVMVHQGGTRISSTRTRALLAEGDVVGAAAQLGRWFTYEGEVVRGHQRGRELGFPTANLPVPFDRAVPADGVYAGFLRRLEEPTTALPAAISVGTNPTFDDVPVTTVEANVLDRDDLDLYDIGVEVGFVRRLRGNTRFDGLDQLITQIGKDVDAARELVGADPTAAALLPTVHV